MTRLILNIFILVFIFSCNSNQSVSFAKFADAYKNWALKKYPVKSLKYNIDSFRGDLHDFSLSNQRDISDDAKRFLIELTQIVPTKLSDQEIYTYNLIEKDINRQIFEIDKLKRYLWDPNIYLDNILLSIKILRNDKSIDEDRNYELLCAIIDQSINTLNTSKDNISLKYLSLENLAKIKIMDIMLELNKAASRYNFDIDRTNYLNSKINNLNNQLNIFQYWLKNDYSKLQELNFSEMINYDNYYHAFVGDTYSFLNVEKLALKKIYSLQNKMFTLSYPLYLENNDKPILIDRLDSLNIISKVIYEETGRNNLSNLCYNSVNKIKDLLSRKKIIDLNEYSSKIKLNISLNNNFSDYSDLLSVSSIYNNKLDSIYIEVKDISIDKKGSLYYNNQVFIETFLKVIPGSSYFQFESVNNNFVERMVGNQLIEFGWPYYLLSNSNDYFDDSLKLSSLHNELIVTVGAYIENKLLNNEYTFDKCSRKFIELAVLNEQNSLNKISKLLNFDLNYNRSFVGANQLNMYKDLFINDGGTLLKFNSQVLDYNF